MTDDPKELLDVVARKQRVTRERFQPGMTDFLVLILAVTTAGGVTGTYDSTTTRALGIVTTLVSAVFVSLLLRSRIRLGGQIPVATWAIPAVLFVTNLVLGFTLDGSARDAAIAMSMVAAAVTLGVVVRSRWIVGLGVSLLVVFALALALAADVGSFGSFGFGIAFGIAVALVSRKKKASVKAS